MELYSKGKKFKGEKVPHKKTGKIVKTTRNHQLIDNLNMKRKGWGTTFEQNITYEK